MGGRGGGVFQRRLDGTQWNINIELMGGSLANGHLSLDGGLSYDTNLCNGPW